MSNRYDDYNRDRDIDSDRFENRDDWNRRRFGRSDSDRNRSQFDRSDRDQESYRSRSYGRGYSPGYGSDTEQNYGSYGSERHRSNRGDYDDSSNDWSRNRSERNSFNTGSSSMSRYGGNYRPNFEAADDAYGSYDTFLRDHPQARPYDAGYGYGRGGRDYSGRDSDWETKQNRTRDSRQERGWWDKVTDELASWFGDEDAERRRRMDEAKGSHRGKGPRGYQRSDERIREDINDRLTDYDYVDASDIVVEVHQRIVTLTGSVDSRWAKRAAEEVAGTVSGVDDVNNQLRVVRTELADAANRQTPSLSTSTSTETTPTTTKTRTKTAGS
jgi:osmotically-inducible protein OsmY